MERIFIQLVNMSLVAGWLILAVLLIRGIFNKLPKLFRCVLWGLVALRLICPWSIESDMSIIPKAEIIADNATKVDILSDKKEIVNNSEDVLHNEVLDNNVIVNGNYEAGNIDTTVKEDSSVKSSQSNVKESSLSVSISTLSKIWAVGIAAMAIYYAVSYVILKRKVRVSIRYDKNIYLCDNISSAFILGLIKPKIYVPSYLSEVELGNVIKHERAHLSRHDNWWKPIGFCLLSVYWFNPLIWIAYIIFCKDIELACDEKVIKTMNVAEVKEYSNTLLECSISCKLIVAAPLAFGEVAVKSRIKSVLNYKRPAFWVIIAGVVISIALVIGFMTKPISYDKSVDEVLDRFISEVILEEYKSKEINNCIPFESHYIIGAKEENNQAIVYMLVNYDGFVWEDNDVKSITGSFVPTVVTAKKDKAGRYVLEEYWKPRDGDFYGDDIREKFPDSLEDEVFNHESFSKMLNEDNYNRAKKYFIEMGYGSDRYLEYTSSEELEIGPMRISLDMKDGTCMTGYYFSSYAHNGSFLLTEEKLILRFPYPDLQSTFLVFRREGDMIIYDKEASENDDVFGCKDGDIFVLEGDYTGDDIPEDLEDTVIEYDKKDHVTYVSSSMNQIDLNMKEGTCSVGNLYSSSRDLEGTFELTSDKLIITFNSMETYYRKIVEVFKRKGDTFVYDRRFSQLYPTPELRKGVKLLVPIRSGVSGLEFRDGEVFKLIENYGE